MYLISHNGDLYPDSHLMSAGISSGSPLERINGIDNFQIKIWWNIKYKISSPYSPFFADYHALLYRQIHLFKVSADGKFVTSDRHRIQTVNRPVRTRPNKAQRTGYELGHRSRRCCRELKLCQWWDGTKQGAGVWEQPTGPVELILYLSHATELHLVWRTEVVCSFIDSQCWIYGCDSEGLSFELALSRFVCQWRPLIDSECSTRRSSCLSIH